MLRSACCCILLLGLTVRAAEPCNLLTLIREAKIDEVARCLNIGGATLANTAADGGVTPLHLAAALDRPGMVKLLIAHGAWVNAPSAGGFTPLHWAAAENATHTMQLLIDNGADLAAITDNGITPLHWAASRNATNSVRMLIKAGMAVAAQTESGQTPLHWAVTTHAEDAAAVLAFQAVSEGIDLAVSNQVPLRLERAAPLTNLPATVSVSQPDALPDIARPNRPPIVLQQDPAPRSGDTRLVPIGRGQVLTFIWVPDAELWMGGFELSNGQFRRFRPGHDSGSRETLSLNGDAQPAVLVSWFDAQAYCEWLNTYFRHSMPKGMRCRLPTHAEWITVARCGRQRRYPWGNDWPPHYGNHADQATLSAFPDIKGIEGYDDGHAVTCDVTAAGVNEWTIHGLAGNVWEWCSDWYDPASRQLKVRQGGGWDHEDPVSLEIETRGFDAPNARYDTIGFRVVLAPVE